MSAIESDLPVPHVVSDINALVGAAFRAANDSRARSSQKELGMSELGSCRRQAGYKFHGTPESNPGHERTDIYADSREAMIGTLIHSLVLPQIEAMSPTAEIEVPVELVLADANGEVLPEIPGSADMVDGDTLLDLKTVSENSLTRYQTHGASRRHIWQTHGYAQALRDAGHRIEHIALVYINRSTGQVAHIHYQRFDPGVIDEIRDWWAEVTQATDPETLPRDEKGPGLSMVCGWCPYLNACWGPDATPGEKGAQRQILDEMPLDERGRAVEESLAKYFAASLAEKVAKGDKEFYREVLTGATSGIYGAMILKWGKPSAWDEVDGKAAREALEAAGLPVPMARRERAAVISVKPNSKSVG